MSSIIILDSKHSGEPSVGRELAARVADQLDKGLALHNSHRDYCGMGLAKDGGKYVYDWVHDGYPPSAAPGGHFSSERLVFNSREEFIGWLQWQSDNSLAGSRLEWGFLRGNQRLTLERLRQFSL